MHTLRSVAWPRPPAVRLCALGISGREGVALHVIGVMGRGQMRKAPPSTPFLSPLLGL